MSSIPIVVHAEPREAYRLLLRFDDGTEGVYDVAGAVPFDGVFAPLRDEAFFASVRVDREAGTVVWPNGADLDPLVLYSRITGKAIELGDVASPETDPAPPGR